MTNKEEICIFNQSSFKFGVFQGSILDPLLFVLQVPLFQQTLIGLIPTFSIKISYNKIVLNLQGRIHEYLICICIRKAPIHSYPDHETPRDPLISKPRHGVTVKTEFALSFANPLSLRAYPVQRGQMKTSHPLNSYSGGRSVY